LQVVGLVLFANTFIAFCYKWCEWRWWWWDDDLYLIKINWSLMCRLFCYYCYYIVYCVC